MVAGAPRLASSQVPSAVRRNPGFLTPSGEGMMLAGRAEASADHIAAAPPTAGAVSRLTSRPVAEGPGSESRYPPYLQRL